MSRSTAATLALFATLLALSPFATAQTTVGDFEQGVWDLAGSPYEMISDVTIPAGGTLVIEPGVEVVGMGVFRLQTAQGSILTALGTKEAPIRFTAANIFTGWRGIRLVEADNSTRLQHCIVEFAVGSGPGLGAQGGGVYVAGCSPTVEDCEIRFCASANQNLNGIGAGLLVDGGGGLYRRNYIHDNAANSGAGIGVFNGSSVEIRNNLITDNLATIYGGGIYVNSFRPCTIEGNRVLRNRVSVASGAGAGLCAWNAFSDASLYRGNVYAFNVSAGQGGGVYLRYNYSRFENELYAFNDAREGGGIYALNQGLGSPVIRNSIVWGNVGDAIAVDAALGTAVAVEHSLVEGSWPGTGNLDVPPLFVSVLGPDGVPGSDDADFRLAPGSPAIDAGFSDSTQSFVDTNGELRIVDDICALNTGAGLTRFLDLGPFERQSSSCCADPVNVCSATPNSASQGAYLSWLGSVSLAQNNFRLLANGLPAQRPGVWFYGFSAQSTPPPIGGGLLCIAGPLFRVGSPVMTVAGGSTELMLDLGSAPLAGPGPGAVMPGSTAWFQLWFRDGGTGGAAFDTTDALRVTFCD